MTALTILGRVWNHPSNASAKLAGLARLVNWQIRKRFFQTDLPFTYHGFTLPGFRDSHSMSAAYYFAGFPDWSEMRFMQDYLRPEDRFLDIGANVGLYSIFAAALVGVKGHVDAFEPASIPANRLQRAVELNQLSDRISIHRLVVTDETGQVEFGFAADDCQSHVRRPGEEHGDAVSVHAVRLDDYCRGRFYAMAKLDIEGHEPVALSGAAGMLANGNPRVMQIEMAGYSKLFGVSTSEFVQRLADAGYDCYYYEPESRKLRSAPQPWEIPIDNVIAIFRDAMPFIQERLATAPTNRFR